MLLFLWTLTLFLGGNANLHYPWHFCPQIRKKWTFDAGYGLTFNFYLFYAICEVFITIGTVLRKIRGVLTWQVSDFHKFPYISFKNGISHIFPSEHAIHSKLSHKQDIDDRNIPWSFEENLTSWRHMTSLYVIWAPARLTTCQNRGP